MESKDLEYIAFEHGYDVTKLDAYRELVTANKLEVWGYVRHFHTDGCVKGQGLKFAEEVGEIFEAIQEGSMAKLRDAIGDSIVVIGIISLIKGYDVETMTIDREVSDSWANITTIDFALNNPLFVANAFDLQRCVGELCQAIAKDKGLIVPINGVMKRLCALAVMLNIKPSECFAEAVSVIENRRGKMVNGVYVKEEDLK